jgi:hypothetical protein
LGVPRWTGKVWIEENNNRFKCFGGIFDGSYISCSIFALIDGGWSFEDILNIKTIWADVSVTNQYFEDI